MRDYMPALSRLLKLLDSRRRVAQCWYGLDERAADRFVLNDLDVRAFAESEDGQVALTVLMTCLELLVAKRDGDDAHVHEIEERLPADTFDHLSDLVARLEHRSAFRGVRERDLARSQ